MCIGLFVRKFSYSGGVWGGDKIVVLSSFLSLAKATNVAIGISERNFTYFRSEFSEFRKFRTVLTVIIGVEYGLDFF